MTSKSNSPRTLPDWITDHIRRYRETNGEDGYIWQGAPTLLLTTKGRHSGDPRTTPLIFGTDGNRYFIVASMGGAPRHPEWYLNLVAHPEVELQIRGERFLAHARTAPPAEKPELWNQMAAIWPAYNDYQARTTREIPVVILERP